MFCLVVFHFVRDLSRISYRIIHTPLIFDCISCFLLLAFDAFYDACYTPLVVCLFFRCVIFCFCCCFNFLSRQVIMCMSGLPYPVRWHGMALSTLHTAYRNTAVVSSLCRALVASELSKVEGTARTSVLLDIDGSSQI